MMLEYTIAAMVGTIGFAVLFSVPRKYYLYCGLIGGMGWMLYDTLISIRLTEAEASFLATVVVVFVSRILAVRERCPATVFAIVGIFPLIPGLGIYQMAYLLVTEQFGASFDIGWNAIKASISIVLGIVVVFEVPQKLFKIFLPKEEKRI